MATALKDWQARRLRDRLLRFRKIETLNGRDRPFERIAMDILDNDKLDVRFVDEQDVRSFGESLRRFAAGKQDSGDERLNALKLFLIQKGYLAKNDLDETKLPIHAPLSMLEFLGVSEQGTDAFYNGLAGSFLAGKPAARGYLIAELEFSDARQDGVVQATVTISLYSGLPGFQPPDDPAQLLRRWSRRERDRYRARQHRADGWAIVSPSRQLMVFLRDRMEGDVAVLIALAHIYTGMSEAIVRRMSMLEYRTLIGNLDALAGRGDIPGQIGDWAKAASWDYVRVAADANKDNADGLQS